MYIPVEDRWVATFDEVRIASKTVAKDKKVVVDSGSSMIVLPNSTLSHFLSQLEHCTLSNDLIKCACPTKNIGAYPTLELVYKEYTFTLEPQFYISTEMNDPFCYPLVSSKPTNEDLILLGSPFIRKYYSIFDRDNMRLGLAKAKQELIRKDKQLNTSNLTIILTSFLVGFSIIWAINRVIEAQLTRKIEGRSLIV